MNQPDFKQSNSVNMRKEFNDYFTELSKKLSSSSVKNATMEDNSGSWNEMADFDNRWSNS